MQKYQVARAAAFAERNGNVLRYRPEISPFIGMPDEPGPPRAPERKVP